MGLDDDEKGKIADRLRQSLTPRLSVSSSPPIPAARSPQEVDREDLDLLRRGSDIYHVSLDSTHKLGKPLGLARRIWRKLLKPLFIRQVHYNSANVRVLMAMQAQIDQLKAENQALQAEVQGRVARPLGQTVDRLRTYETSIQELHDVLKTQRAQIQERIDDLQFTEKQQSRAIVRLHKQVKTLQADRNSSRS
jgi:hypothetical protein